MLAAIVRLLLCALCFECVYHATLRVCTQLSLIKGTQRKLTLEDILRDQLLCFTLFAACALVLSFAIVFWLVIPGLIAACLLTKKAPAMLDKRAVKALRSACDEHVDMMADLVAMGIASGLSFDAALSLYCSKFDNVLASQLKSAQFEWTSGLASRHMALSDLSQRVDSKALQRFSESSLQAIQHGAPLAETLRRFSHDVRQRRRIAIERQIEKAPVKMLVPTGTCILPAMLVLVAGPVLLQFVQSSM